MRYGTWNIVYFPEDPENGVTPIGFSGAFFLRLEEKGIAGYLPEDAAIEDYSLWSAKEVTADEFLESAQQVNSAAKLDSDGFIWFPSLEVLI